MKHRLPLIVLSVLLILSGIFVAARVSTADAPALPGIASVAEQPYDAIAYRLDDPKPVVSFYMPRTSLSAVTRFELRDAAMDVPAVGKAFELLAFQGSRYKMWDKPLEDFDLQPAPFDPPAVLVFDYAGADLTGFDPAKLALYRLGADGWEEAVYPGYRFYRFLDDDRIAVPVCQTGVFALSDKLVAPPTADFSASPTVGSAPLKVTFCDASTGPPTSWAWTFGDGASSIERNPVYTYTASGHYTVTLTVSNALGSASRVVRDCVTVLEEGENTIYLPLVVKRAGSTGPSGPDLVIKALTASSDTITVIIQNQGDEEVSDAFWVDVYIDPSEPPSLNKIWQAIAAQGLAWGVTDPVLPGGELSLTIGGAYYVPEESHFVGGMPPDTPVWAQVDAVNYETSYGAVLERDEGNNVLGPVSSLAGGEGADVPRPSNERAEPVPTHWRLPWRW